MNPTVLAPPPPTAKGCCGIGCLTLFALLAFLAFAFVGGGLWALHHFRQTYSSTEPTAMPEPDSSAPTAAVSPVTRRPSEASPDETVPAPGPTPIDSSPVPARWEAFERAAKRGQKASITLSAADINALIGSRSHLRGKAFVTIQNNIGHVRVSIPLKDVVLMKGRYLNGEATVQASPDGDPGKAQITNVILANQAVPDGVLDRRLFGWSSMRGMMQDWLNDENIAVFKIENDRVIGETRGQ